MQILFDGSETGERRKRMHRVLKAIHSQGQIYARQRRRMRVVVLTTISLLYSGSRIVDPDAIRIPVHHVWFEETVMPHWTDREWIRNFRMKKASFQMLCQLLEPALPQREVTNAKKPVPLEKRVTICIWRLATPCEYRTIGHLFGVARSTACMITHEVVAAIIAVVYPQYVKWPNGNELLDVVRGFEYHRGMPQCAGAIDGTHIHVTPPEEQQANYLNRKGFHSIVLQAVCDYRLR